MRIGFFFSQFFWGGLLILLGISAILRSFNINIPILRIVFALFFIYLGITILTGHGIMFDRDRNTVLFSETEINVGKNLEKEYNIIFGKGVVDLTDISLENGSEEVEINTIFGSGQIRISPDIPVRIEASSAFGNARMPNGSSITFGDINYNSGGIEPGTKYLTVKASVVFGSLEVFRE